MSKQGLISICSLVLVATGTLWADHIIYDEFDDGDLATNTNGIGNGFVGAGSKGTTAWTETDGQTLIHATNNGNRDRVNSIDTFDTTAGLTATWVISDIARGDDNGNAGRMLVGPLLQQRLETLDWKAVADDVRPFLERPTEESLLSCTHLKALIDPT